MVTRTGRTWDTWGLRCSRAVAQAQRPSAAVHAVPRSAREGGVAGGRTRRRAGAAARPAAARAVRSPRRPRAAAAGRRSRRPPAAAGRARPRRGAARRRPAARRRRARRAAARRRRVGRGRAGGRARSRCAGTRPAGCRRVPPPHSRSTADRAQRARRRGRPPAVTDVLARGEDRVGGQLQRDQQGGDPAEAALAARRARRRGRRRPRRARAHGAQRQRDPGEQHMGRGARASRRQRVNSAARSGSELGPGYVHSGAECATCRRKRPPKGFQCRGMRRRRDPRPSQARDPAVAEQVDEDLVVGARPCAVARARSRPGGSAKPSSSAAIAASMARSVENGTREWPLSSSAAACMVAVARPRSATTAAISSGSSMSPQSRSTAYGETSATSWPGAVQLGPAQPGVGVRLEGALGDHRAVALVLEVVADRAGR